MMFNDISKKILRASDLVTFDPAASDAASVECMLSHSLMHTPLFSHTILENTVTECPKNIYPALYSFCFVRSKIDELSVMRLRRRDCAFILLGRVQDVVVSTLRRGFWARAPTRLANYLLILRQRIQDVLVLLQGEVRLLLHASEVEAPDFLPEGVVGLLRLYRVGRDIVDRQHVGLHVVRLAAQVVTHQPPRLGFNVLLLRPDDLLRNLQRGLLARDVILVALGQDWAVGLAVAER